MLVLQYGQATDAGTVRAHNEDAFGAFTPDSAGQAETHGYLFALADGVGGMACGEVASSTAVRVLTEEFPQATENTPLASLLTRLVQHANTAVYESRMLPEHDSKPMATTLVACALRGDRAVVCHVGDSRCYLIRGGAVRQLTEDHTVVNEQRRRGRAVSAAQRHVITRAIGVDRFITPDTTPLSLQPNDIFILTSDGVHDETPAEEIAVVAGQESCDLDAVARDLVRRAVQRDGRDNATVQIIRVVSVPQD